MILMQKNETILLPIWLKYYSELFGKENLYIFDNGSGSDFKKDLFGLMERMNLDDTKDKRSDFERKGQIISAKIKELDAVNPSDFYFPLDADEFIGVRMDDGQISLEKEDIENELSNYLNSPDILMLEGGYDNFPSRPGFFVYKKHRKKCFFAANSCEDLCLGFHDARTKRNGVKLRTRIINLHMHNKPFDMYRSHALQKLAGRVVGFDKETLLEHRRAKGKGFHLVDRLLYESEEDFNAAFGKKFPEETQFAVPQFEEKLKSLGFEIPY